MSSPALQPSRLASTFGVLILIQAVHSVEECAGRLWESYPPARFIADLFSTNHGLAFGFMNGIVVAVGAWCYFWPVQHRWAIAPALLWFWVSVEIFNGLAHLAWAFWQRTYTPGVATAPFLIIVALILARQIRRGARG